MAMNGSATNGTLAKVEKPLRPSMRESVRARRPNARKPIIEYHAWPKGIYPMSDGWCPPSYPKEEALMELEEKHLARKKAVMVKKHVCVKEAQYEKLTKTDLMKKTLYSLLVYPITEGDFSGEGEDKTFFLIVFYEPSNKSKVERVFKSVGADLHEYEQVVVDPDTVIKEEEDILWAHGDGETKLTTSDYEYCVVEKGTPEYDDPWGPAHPEGRFWE